MASDAEVKALVYDFAEGCEGEPARRFRTGWPAKFECDDFKDHKRLCANGVTFILPMHRTLDGQIHGVIQIRGNITSALTQAGTEVIIEADSKRWRCLASRRPPSSEQ
jgi:hypothetical protein